MVSRASGYSTDRKELLFVECEGFSISLKGPPLHPKVGALQLHPGVQSTLRISGPCFISANIAGLTTSQLVIYSDAPTFFEETDYVLVVETDSSETEVKFWHRDVGLRNSYTPVGHSGCVFSALLNFGSQVGNTDLVFRKKGHEAIRLTLEIFPTKIDYQKDWRELISRISERLYNLTYSFQKPTYQRGEALPRSCATLAEWYAILEPRFGNLMRAIDFISRSPHRKIVEEERIRPLSLVRKSSRNVRSWIRRHPALLRTVEQSTAGAVKIGREFALPVWLPESRARLTFNTFANRFLKALIISIHGKLEELQQAYETLCTQPHGPTIDPELLQKIKLHKTEIQRRLQYDFLREADWRRHEQGFSTVLQFAPGYREAFEVGLALKLGLELSSAIEQIELKNLYDLYEIWCFLELEKLLGELCVAKEHTGQRFANKQLFWSLLRNEESAARFATGFSEELVLQYNHTAVTPTGYQRPDNLVTIQKRGGTAPFMFILDAKYRVSTSGAFIGPMTDDINAMHRYRDAMVRQEGRQAARLVTEAIVLFPLADEESYLGSQFHQSISKVGVGALPFLPQSQNGVRQLLARWIGESAELLDEESVGVEEHLRQGLVLLGPISPALVLEDVEKLGYYHVPKEKVALDRRHITHVAIYESGKESGHGVVRKLFPIHGWEVVPRNLLTAPSMAQRGTEVYYRIDLDVKAAEKLNVPKRRTTPWGAARRHRYVPLSVFDSTDVLEVMAAEESIAKIRLRIWRFVEFLRHQVQQQPRLVGDWFLEFGARRKVLLKEAEGHLLLLHDGVSHDVGALGEPLRIAALADRINKIIV